MFANFSSALSIERENVMFMQRTITCTARGPGLPLIGHWITILGSHWPVLTVTVCNLHSLLSAFSRCITVSLFSQDHASNAHIPSQIELRYLLNKGLCISQKDPVHAVLESCKLNWSFDID